MSPSEIITVCLAGVTTLLIPLIVFLVRGAIKWSRVESDISHLVIEVKNLVADKDRAHSEIFTQMREDRAATDKRLRWLEQYLWSRSTRNAHRDDDAA